jgi:hypothetical protein
MHPARTASAAQGEGQFNQTGTAFLDCLDETVSFEVSIPFRFTQVTTPSGTVLITNNFSHTPTGTMIGLASGRTWAAGRMTLPEEIKLTADGVTVDHFTANEWFVGDPTFKIHQNIFLTQDAVGTMTFNRFDVGCTAH